MRKLLTIAVTAVAALSLTATGFADPGKEKKAKKHAKYTFTVTTTDNGSCGQPWANDVVRRTFQIKKNKDGSYTLTRRDKGAFTTIGGASPGSCDTTGNHGLTVVPGVKGKLTGYIRGKVTGGTFNPNATCTASDCGFTDVFIAAFFGTGAAVLVLHEQHGLQVQLQLHGTGEVESAASLPPLAGQGQGFRHDAQGGVQRRHRDRLNDTRPFGEAPASRRALLVLGCFRP